MVNIVHLVLFFFISNVMNAQKFQPCRDASKLDMVVDEGRVESFVRQAISTRSLEVDTITLNPVIIRSPKLGYSSATMEALDISIGKVNEYFQHARLYFQYCGEPQIVENEEFFHLKVEEGKSLNAQYHLPNAINLYIAGSLSEDFPDGSVGLYCGIASFPNPDYFERYILLDGSCLGEGQLLAHELGHFYGLYHTHEVSFGKELVSKLNCEIAGDLICDTPADPLLSTFNVSGCRYIGDEVDAEGDSYRPDTRNLMSYSPPQCSNQFSWNQQLRMMAIHRNENSYLISDCNLPDFTVEIDTSFASFRPGQSFKLPVTVKNEGKNDLFNLKMSAFFTDDLNEEGQLLETISFLVPPDGNELAIRMAIKLPIDLPEERQYIMVKIDAENQIAELNENNNESSIAYILNYGDLPSLVMYPNPATELTKVFLRDPSFEGTVDLKVLAANGQVVAHYSGIKSYETFQAEIDVSPLENGLYFLHLLVGEELKYRIKFIKL